MINHNITEDDLLVVAYCAGAEHWVIVALRQLGNVVVDGPFETEDDAKKALLEIEPDPANDRD